MRLKLKFGIKKRIFKQKFAKKIRWHTSDDLKLSLIL